MCGNVDIVQLGDNIKQKCHSYSFIDMSCEEYQQKILPFEALYVRNRLYSVSLFPLTEMSEKLARAGHDRHSGFTARCSRTS